MTKPIAAYEDMTLRFFAYAKERERIRIRRFLEHPAPWTDDLILQTYSFCNVHREDDRTTKWYARNVRGRYAGDIKVLLATVTFRWFNRVTTGQAIFNQLSLDGTTAFDRFAADGDPSHLEHAARAYQPKGPWITGAYMVPSPQGLGLDKLSGIAKCCGDFWGTSAPFLDADDWNTWSGVADWLAEYPGQASLQQVWKWLTHHPFQGGFNAYEVVTDLRHTYLLRDAPDIMTWANAGPGAVRGLNRILGRPLKTSLSQVQAQDEMQDLLQASRAYWPEKIENVYLWAWDMRTVEHTLCEFDKYERLRLGEGTVKRKFHVQS